jgi:hypothetical protein
MKKKHRTNFSCQRTFKGDEEMYDVASRTNFSKDNFFVLSNNLIEST